MSVPASCVLGTRRRNATEPCIRALGLSAVGPLRGTRSNGYYSAGKRVNLPLSSSFSFLYSQPSGSRILGDRLSCFLAASSLQVGFRGSVLRSKECNSLRLCCVRRSEARTISVTRPQALRQVEISAGGCLERQRRAPRAGPPGLRHISWSPSGHARTLVHHERRINRNAPPRAFCVARTISRHGPAPSDYVRGASGSLQYLMHVPLFMEGTAGM